MVAQKLIKYIDFTGILGTEKMPVNASLDYENEEKSSTDNSRQNGFSFLLCGSVVMGILGSVGLLNWLVDPLWFNAGNRITGQNFAFNERISKTNQFLKSDISSYDCLILGSSRVTALNASQFEGHNCYNYSFKGGWAEDFIAVSEFVKEQGLDPAVIYVGIDEFNFVEKEENTAKSNDFSENKTQSAFHAYFSSNVLLFSLMTLAGVSPDKTNYYDRNFETQEFPNASRHQADFYSPAPPQECDLSRVSLYANVREIFPNATIIGYVPPRSAWSVVNETYNRDIMGCVLEGFHQVASIYDGMYDFSIPSDMTMDPNNTYDGSHFTVESNNQVAAMLEGRSPLIGIEVKGLGLENYQDRYMTALQDFLVSEGRPDLFKD